MKCNVFGIWDEHENRLKNYIHRRVHNSADAEDILHTVFFKVYNYCEKKSDVTNLRSWLYQICYHAIVDHYKQKSKRRELSEHDLSISDSELLADKAAEWIQPLLSQLPKEYADSLKMADIEGVKQQEIADKKSISLTAAKSRVQRARKKLKEKFLECGVVERDGDHLLYTVTKPCCKNLLPN